MARSLKMLMVDIYKKGVISSKNQAVMSTLSFYIGIKDLKKMGLVELDGSYRGGEEKKWKLTKKGRELAKIFIKMNQLLREK